MDPLLGASAREEDSPSSACKVPRSFLKPQRTRTALLLALLAATTAIGCTLLVARRPHKLQRPAAAVAGAEAELGARALPFGFSAVRNIAVPNWGGNCGGPYKVNVYLPTPSTSKRPLVVFSHGYGQGGRAVQQQLEPGFLRNIVQNGFAVIAHQTGRDNWCNTGIELIHTLDWAKASSYAPKIDFSRVGVMGYSMGGYFVTFFSEYQNLINGYKVKAAVSLMAPCQNGCKPQSKTATYWGAGTADTTSPDVDIRKSYNEMRTGKGKVFADIPGAPHYEVGVYGRNRHTGFVNQFLRCHLNGLQGQCNAVYNRWPSERPAAR